MQIDPAMMSESDTFGVGSAQCSGNRAVFWESRSVLGIAQWLRNRALVTERQSCCRSGALVAPEGPRVSDRRQKRRAGASWRGHACQAQGPAVYSAFQTSEILASVTRNVSILEISVLVPSFAINVRS